MQAAPDIQSQQISCYVIIQSAFNIAKRSIYLLQSFIMAGIGNGGILFCDITFINEEGIRFLMNKVFGIEDCIAPTHDGRSEPLCAIYSKECANVVKDLIEANQLSVRAALNNINTQFIDVSHQNFYSENLFMNINSKEELKNINESNLHKNDIHEIDWLEGF